MYLIGKRLFDLLISGLSIIALFPLFVLVAIIIKADSKGPVFFRQERVGYQGLLFEIIKFRTMIVNAEKIGAGLFVEENDLRITRVGKLLRHTSMDELPQLINIFKGEMSLVGPRPTLAYQVEKYDQRQKNRLSVKPGITGWAQINGRNALTWPVRIELDLWYIENKSFWLDLKIIFRTIFVLFRRQGLYKDDKYDPISDRFILPAFKNDIEDQE